MGKLVAFWSPYEGHGKTTASLCAVLGGLIIQYPELSLAVSHVKNDMMPLLSKVDNNASIFKDNSRLNSFGIDALRMYIGQNMLSSETIRRCGMPLFGQSIYVYPNISRNEKGDDVIVPILSGPLKEEFDVVCLDLKSGEKEAVYRYMKTSDFVIVVLPQEPFYVEKFFREQEEILYNVEYGIVFGGCFIKSKYKSNYYKKIYGKKRSDKFLGDIYWNCDFFNAMSEGKTLDFFFRNAATIKNEENYEFFIQVKKASEHIRKKIINL